MKHTRRNARRQQPEEALQGADGGRDVSFEVKSGEVVGLLGPNGAGKTTCFYMIVGLVAADAGEVYIDDNRLTHQPDAYRPGSACPTCRRKPRSSAS